MNFQWFQIELFGPKIEQGRVGHCSQIINDKLFIFGGCDEDNKYPVAKILCIELDILKNRNTSKCISLIKTKYPAKEELETFKLEDKELIINVIFYLDEKSNQLKGLSLKTNFGNVKLIGNDQNAKAINETKINEGEENIIIGFGGYYSQKSGITSIYCTI